MSITPYSTPAEAPIMDTYVPIPFEAMYQAGAMTQGRYDENMELEETIGSDISKYGGAQRVNIPGLQNQYIKMPDYDVVEGVKEGYNTELNDITSSISDKSSPELRAKLKGLGSRIRNDIGPNGKIGIATSNMKEIENFNKMLRDNPKLANSPQLVPYIQRLRAHEEATKDGSIQRLDLSGAPGEDVDITKKLTDLLKNYGEQSGIPGLGSVNGFPGLIRELQASGIKEEDIQNTVTNFLRTDPEAANQLQLQAQFDNYRGGETTAEGLIGNYANIMGDVFSKSKVTSKLRDNNVFMANYKKALKTNDVATPYVRPTIIVS